jgi:glycosyltransferase involved in cell wall biosynthesis
METWFYRHGIRRALREATIVASVSKATSHAIACFSPETATRIRLTRSGVASDFSPLPAPDGLLRRFGLTSGRRYVLTVGQNAPYKNHQGALAAFAAAFGQRQDVELVMVQRLGRQGYRLSAQADALGISDRVKFLADLSRQDLVRLYSSAAALLHPSHCEGFGNPLAEAMACGCPIVTSNCSAMPEVTAGAALLAHPRDPIAIGKNLQRVVDNPALARRLSERGLTRAKELCWQRFVEKNVSIYKELLGPEATET